MQNINLIKKSGTLWNIKIYYHKIPNKEAKTEMETHPVFESKIKCSKYVRAVQIQKVFKIS